MILSHIQCTSFVEVHVSKTIMTVSFGQNQKVLTRCHQFKPSCEALYRGLELMVSVFSDGNSYHVIYHRMAGPNNFLSQKDW